MKFSERMRTMIRNWLQIQPASGQSITIREAASWETNCMRNRVWYRGDAWEIEQLFKALGPEAMSGARFWAAAPSGSDVRKAHSGLPAIMVDTLAYLVKSDLNEVDFDGKDSQAAADAWEEIADDCNFSDVVGDAVAAVLALGDGAFKISIDPDVSDYPLLEFWPADKVEFSVKHGRTTGVIFKSLYTRENAQYELQELYEVGHIRYRLMDGDKEIPLDRVPELAGYKPITYEGDFPLAIPLLVYKSQKYPSRGRSVFDAKTDAFDAHDEVISQWIDAVRAGRVQRYIPEDMIPRNPNDGTLITTNSVNGFGANFVAVKGSLKENAVDKIETVQPEIRYDAFLQSYTTTLSICLQGVMSPATLGIDVGKMASAEAQREKKDVTGYTRNAVTDVLEKVLPQVVRSLLMAYDAMQNRTPGRYKPAVSFGEYGAPDFDSRVATIAAAATASVMSVEAQVDELWGASRDDAWKTAETARIRQERGLAELDEPAVGADARAGAKEHAKEETPMPEAEAPAAE